MATRRESVRLSLEDAGFSTGMARAAAATALLERQLDDLDGTQIATSRSTRSLAGDQDSLSRSAVEGSRSIDRFSGRLGILLKAAAVLGPTLVPIGAVGIAGVAGLANQLGFAAIAAGTTVLAFQDIGTALTAVNKASLEPTVENLQAAHEALMNLTPAGRQFVTQLDQMRPILTALRDTAQEGLFPGLVEGFESLERLAPAIDTILRNVSETLGGLFAEGAASLASDRWADFFSMLATEARPVLTDMGHALGSVVHGLSEMWEAFAPLNRDFGSWLADAAASFDRWATGLSRTEGFQEFVQYLRDNGPKVAEAFGAIGDAVVQIVQAAAPLGGPVLEAITHIADAIAVIADSPLGTPIMAGVTAISAMSLAANVATASVTRLNAALAMTGPASANAGAGGAGAMAAGAGPAGIALLLGAINIPGEIDYIKDLADAALSGDKNVVQLSEGVGRFVAAMNPAGQVAQAFGLDILGMGDNSADTALAVRLLADSASEVPGPLSDIRDGYDDMTPVLRRTQRAMREQSRESARAEAQAESLAAALEEQRAQVQATADQWTDYSQKVQLGETSVDQLMNRWDKLGTASANMASNIREAIRDGLDPKIIKDVIDTLGPQGAALALEQFANASGREATRIERSFRRMSRGTHDFEDAYDGLAGLVSGNGLSMGVGRQSDKIVAAAARARAAIMGIPTSHSTAIKEAGAARVAAAADQARAAVSGIPATSHTTIKEDGAAEVAAAAARARAAVTSIPTSWTTTIRTVRVGGDTAGGPPEIRGADGMTVPGRRAPYGDKIYAYLAPGEEVISNRFGQADRNRALLKAINANRYANGGTVRSARPVSSAQRLNINVSAGELTGSIRTPAGQVDLRAVIRAEAQDVYAQERNFERSQS